MALNHLMWIFGGLFVFFGLLLGVSGSEAAKTLWGGLSVTCLGGFALAMAADGIVRGQIRFQFSIIRRAATPRLFWATVCLVAAAGIGVLIAAVWAVFFK